MDIGGVFGKYEEYFVIKSPVERESTRKINDIDMMNLVVSVLTIVFITRVM